MILAVDEEQKIKDWPAIVKLLWDEDSRMKVPLKVVLTGSSSLMTQKGTTESLIEGSKSCILLIGLILNAKKPSIFH